MHYLAPEMVGDFNDTVRAVSDHKAAKLADYRLFPYAISLRRKLHMNVEYIWNKCAGERVDTRGPAILAMMYPAVPDLVIRINILRWNLYYFYSI